MTILAGKVVLDANGFTIGEASIVFHADGHVTFGGNVDVEHCEDGAIIKYDTLDVSCRYCGNERISDARGGCSACGAPL